MPPDCRQPSKANMKSLLILTFIKHDFIVSEILSATAWRTDRY